MRLAPHSQRPALSLLEVIVATAVFLFCLVAIGQLITFGADRAVDVREKTRATELAQSKMGEVVAGVTPMSSQDAQPTDEDPDYQWSMSTTDQSSIAPGLTSVAITVTHERPGQSPLRVTLNRMVFNTTYRGNISVPASPPTDSNTTASSSGSGSSSGTSGSSQSTSAMGGALPGGMNRSNASRTTTPSRAGSTTTTPGGRTSTTTTSPARGGTAPAPTPSPAPRGGGSPATGRGATGGRS